MRVTKDEIKMNFKGYDIVIPKGTRTTHKTAMGIDKNYNFVDDLTWINKRTNYPLWHDAEYHGIDIPAELLEDI